MSKILERTVGTNVTEDRDLAHGVDLMACVVGKIGEILQMDVTVPLEEPVSTNVS